MFRKSLFLNLAMAPAPRDVSFSQAAASSELYDFLEVLVDITAPNARN